MKKAPAKRTRNPQQTRTQILQVAFHEVYRKGFQGVSVNEIIEKTDLTKGAFFHHFPTKESLGYALVDEVISGMILDRWIHPLDEFENPLEGIISVLKKIIETMPEEHFAFGCPLNNLIQEMSPVDPIFREKLHQALEVWIAGVDKNLKRAQTRGYLKKEIHGRRLAEFIVMNHEGAFGMIKSVRDRKVFRSLHASLKEYLESLQNEVK